MVHGRRQIRRGWDGKFKGFRLNCEQIPILPAWAVRWVWDDPRRIPYLLIWKNRRDGRVTEAVRVARSTPRAGRPEAASVEIKRTDGTAVSIYLCWRSLPLGGRSLLLRCWRCQMPSRALYGFKVGDDGKFYKAVIADWGCRRCNELRYASEGGALVFRGGLISRFLGRPLADVRSPRPEVWLPYVFTSIDDSRLDEIAHRNRHRRENRHFPERLA
jgi:hypothetical protein